jgi:hypothetical protein
MGASSESPEKVLVVIFGPPAVGKMTVGRELARRTGLRLFHNHATIDLALRFFAFGEPAYQRLVSEFRRRIFEEVAASGVPGLVFTYVWAFDDPSDADFVESLAEIFRSQGGSVFYVELEAPQSVRLHRNETPFRLAEKPTKRDLETSRAQLLQDDAAYRLNSVQEFQGRSDYLRIDNTDLEPGLAAERIIETFGLRRESGS